MEPIDPDSVQVCTEIASEGRRVFECVTVEQDVFSARTYVIVGVIILCTLLVLVLQHRYFAKFDCD